MHVEEEGFRALTREDPYTPARSATLVVCRERHGLAVRSPAVPVLRVIAARHIEREVERDLVGVDGEGGAWSGRRNPRAPEPESIDDRIGENSRRAGLGERVHHDDEVLLVPRRREGEHVAQVGRGIRQRARS
jgi:hypothetical protein